ncbi:MAG: ATP-dependent DNA ligase [Myxococcota bacterium]
MKRFSQLYLELDRTTSTNAKIDAMARYFESAPPEDAAWAVFFLSGQRFKRLVGWRPLTEWALAESAIPAWLFDECRAAVGDLAETIALLIDGTSEGEVGLPLHQWVARVQKLRGAEDQEAQVTNWWRTLDRPERFVLDKLLTGALRVGVSKPLVIRALTKASGVPRNVLQHRMSGNWEPSGDSFRALVDPDAEESDPSRPYPFYLASPLEKEPEELGDAGGWMAEWKWDGIRGQLLRRKDEVFLWSRGEELLTERFPDLADASNAIPVGTALDGELLCWDHEAKRPLPFAILQTRIQRKKLSAKILKDAPARFVAYDLMEHAGEDVRSRPQHERRKILEKVVASLDPHFFGVSEVVDAKDWAALRALRETSRSRGVEGLMLKAKEGPYRTGRKRGEWWKWKIDPLTLDCVLVYAQAGHGKRAGLFTDYTFAVWGEPGDDGERPLTTIAKAYSGLDNEEIRELDKWIRRNTLERFGPVRSVEPTHVFEIAFEGIRKSKRHKSGVAVRFPRIARWRRDKTIKDADSIAAALALLDLE